MDNPKGNGTRNADNFSCVRVPAQTYRHLTQKIHLKLLQCKWWSGANSKLCIHSSTNQCQNTQSHFRPRHTDTKCWQDAGRRRVSGLLPARPLHLAWKHISRVKAIWLDLEKGIRKQHKAKRLETFDTDALILSTVYLQWGLQGARHGGGNQKVQRATV